MFTNIKSRIYKMKNILLPLLVFLCLLSCSTEEVQEIPNYTMETVDGVKHIHNQHPKWQESSEVELEFVRKIGDMESEDENYMFYLPHDIVVDTEQNIYVLDTGNNRIQKYNSRMEYIMTIGNKGQGPGEFGYPNRFYIDRKDVLYIYDSALKRYQLYTKDGTPHSDFKPEMKYILNQDRLSTGEFVSAVFLPYRFEKNESDEEVYLLQKLDPQGSLLFGFGERFEYNDPVANTSCNSVRIAHDSEDNLYVTMVYQNRIEKYSIDGKLIFKSDRPLNYDVSVPRSKVNGGNVSFMKNLNFISEGIGIDGKDRIWVLTRNRQEKEEEHIDILMLSAGNTMSTEVKGNTDLTETDMFKLEIFNGEGILLTEIPLAQFCDHLRVYNDRIFCIDSYRGMCIYEYRIKEK